MGRTVRLCLFTVTSATDGILFRDGPTAGTDAVRYVQFSDRVEISGGACLAASSRSLATPPSPKGQPKDPERLHCVSSRQDDCLGDDRVRNWRRGWDSNPRSDRSDAGFQDRCIQPLCHLSDVIKINYLVYPSEQIARERMAQVAESYLTQLCPA